MISDVTIDLIRNDEDLVIANVTCKTFSTCTFVFYGNNINCFGDIDSFNWCCTWDTPKALRNANFFAHNTFYFYEKLEHKYELENFSREHFLKTLDDIKQEHYDELDDEEEKKIFLSKWNDNEYLLSGVDGYRLNGFDDFCYEMEIYEGDYYSKFFVMDNPHYDVAVEMIQKIEEYFKENVNGKISK